MADGLRDIADRRFAEALASTGARDPREFYRERLKALQESAPAAFAEASEYYRSRLIPAIARDGREPIGEWLEYGRLLATLTVAGETVQIDPSGRSRPYSPPVPLDELVLHLPRSSRETAVPVGLPVELSAAQHAAYDLLVRRRTR